MAANGSKAPLAVLADDTETIGHDTFFLLSVIHARSVRVLTQALGSLDLRPRHVIALRCIAANQGLSQQELVRGLASDSSTVVALIDDFEARGMAERRRNPRDRRTYSVYLTQKGEDGLAAGAKVLSDVSSDLLACLDADERATFSRVLEKLASQE